MATRAVEKTNAGKGRKFTQGDIWKVTLSVDLQKECR